MTLSTKILIAVVALVTLCFGGFLIYKNYESGKQLNALQQSIIEQKQLLDGITRAQSQYASKADIDSYAKDRDVNLGIIKQDLETLGAQVDAISGITVVTKPQLASNLGSTSVVPRPQTPSDPPIDPSIPDPFGYQKGTQKLTLNEVFADNSTVPFGDVGFSAWKDKPWDINILQRKYLVTSVLGQDENGRHYSYSKFAIQIGDKNYDVKIDDAKFLEEMPSLKFSWWNPRLHVSVGAGASIGLDKPDVRVSAPVALGMSVASYGKTTNNPLVTFVEPFIGIDLPNKTPVVGINPINLNIGQAVGGTLIQNLYIGPSVAISLDKHLTVGLAAGLAL